MNGSALRSALVKLCLHKVGDSLSGQVAWLQIAGFPQAALSVLGKKLLNGLKKQRDVGTHEPKRTEKKKLAIIPYVYCFLHRLKKIASH